MEPINWTEDARELDELLDLPEAEWDDFLAWVREDDAEEEPEEDAEPDAWDDLAEWGYEF